MGFSILQAELQPKLPSEVIPRKNKVSENLGNWSEFEAELEAG